MIPWLDSEVSLSERYVQINKYIGINKYTSVIIIVNIQGLLDDLNAILVSEV